VSDWNDFLDRKLSLDLHLEASRLADALARDTLGWNMRENEIGQQLLRDQTRLHGRSFERARDELVKAGLIRFSPGTGGRGHRDHYELLLTPAKEREISSKTPAERSAETPAPERGRKEKGEGEDQEHSFATLADARARERERTVFDGETVSAVKELVSYDLVNADEKTELTLLRNFGDLPPKAFDYVGDELARLWEKGDYPDDDAEYAYGILANIAWQGYPDEPHAPIPLPGDPDFISFIAEAHRQEHLTDTEAVERVALHRALQRAVAA
jgi:hypothetical protein